MIVDEVILKQLKCKDLSILEPIVKEMGEHIVDGMLSYNEEQWFELNTRYDKETLRDALTITIPHYKVDFPFEIITESDVKKSFEGLKNLKLEEHIIVPEVQTFEVKGVIKKKKVIEKFNDYKYSYENQGVCVIKGNPRYNDVSDYFQSKNRHQCGTWSLPSTYEAWTTGKGLRTNLGAMWRMGTNKVTRSLLKQSIRLGTYIATQFKPSIAKLLYDAYKTEKIIDISCGWGDRLAGFYTSDAKEYYGFDPNPATFQVYKEQCIYYEKLLGNKNPEIGDYGDYFIIKGIKKVIIQNRPAEDADFDLIPNDIDFVFSSPPYFSLEAYGKGVSGEENQSWCRYKEYDDWEKGFFHPVLTRCWDKLDQERGIMAINIVDVIIKNQRHYICERMIEYMENDTDAEYAGQIGMKMNLRPNTRNDDVSFDQTNKIPFIEPIWVFKKALDNRDILCYNKCEDIGDLFE